VMSNQTVKEIVEESLRANGYGGLYCPGAGGECACKLGDLMSDVSCVLEGIEECEAGYLQAGDDDHEFYISTKEVVRDG